jgi:hypothetical protein
MMKAIATLAAAGLATVGAFGLADVTQNRPDPVDAGTVTAVTFDVDTRDYQRGDGAAAQALWALCSATVGGEVTGPAAPDATADGGHDGGYTVTISPAIGENGRKRLVGCLEDATLDRVMGSVESITTQRPSG